ncbi:DUF3344 domain-containing protein [Streptomyces paludis]|uniref:DUF3344 domain-containing protein n=1 Tax=Streptomyces paludis TaxID=2282738 RepID=A0A345HSD1_9ACTN|nr:DUF3344 domain-containing protein [Streptomyces paludis]AXG79605.1 DUF3344 domain-containing protein [Streptomyces paludis]
MRNSAVRAVGRGVLCGLAVLSLSAAVYPPVVPSYFAPRAGAREDPRIPFAARWYAVQHGGIVRAANAAISCRAEEGDRTSACAAARAGGDAANQQFDMFYSDVDDDPNTYNSTRAELRLPDRARVSYARLYWGGNLLVGEQKPAADNGRVLIAEPGGRYKEILADTVIGHRIAGGADAYQASADVTTLVKDSGPGMYTVAQLNVAMGRSGAGAWGGWTLVVAYKKDDDPLRHLSIWDGFDLLDARHEEERVDLGAMPIPERASGRLGVVAYDGDRGVTGDTLAVETGKGKGVLLSNKDNPSDDVMNSSITDFDSRAMKREPDYANTLGYDSDVFDLRGALASGADRLSVRFGTERDSFWIGAFFVEADAQF